MGLGVRLPSRVRRIDCFLEDHGNGAVELVEIGLRADHDLDPGRAIHLERGPKEAPLDVGVHPLPVDARQLQVHAHVAEPRKDAAERSDQGAVRLEHEVVPISKAARRAPPLVPTAAVVRHR